MFEFLSVLFGLVMGAFLVTVGLLFCCTIILFPLGIMYIGLGVRCMSYSPTRSTTVIFKVK